MENLLEFNLFNFSFVEFTSGKSVETFTEECSTSQLKFYANRQAFFGRTVTTVPPAAQLVFVSSSPISLMAPSSSLSGISISCSIGHV